jgi:hypothetical protein
MAELNPPNTGRLIRSRPQRFGSYPAQLRARAVRYRHLIETLADPGVIAVVQACSLELEARAILIETGDDGD